MKQEKQTRPYWLRRILVNARQSARLCVFVAFAYYLGAEAAFYFGTLTEMFAPFWPPNIVLLCALLMAQQRHWWMLLLAAFPAHIIAELGVHMPVPQLLMAFACNAAFAVLSAAALRALRATTPWLGTLRNAGLFLLVTAGAVPALVALAAGFEPALGDGNLDLYWTYWGRWYLSNALGSLMLAPVFLTWFAGGTRWITEATSRKWIEAIALATVLIVVCAVAWVPQLHGDERYMPAMLYTPIPLLLIAAVRFGGTGASAAILVVTSFAIWQSMQGYNPLVQSGTDHGVLALQLFLAVISVPIILVAGLVEELRRKNEELSSVLDGISDAYYTVDNNLRLTFVSSRAIAWSGNKSNYLGQRSRDFFGGRSPASEAIMLALANRKSTYIEWESLKYPGRWLEFKVYPSAEGASIFFRDITSRKTAELAERNTRELLQSTMDSLSAQIAIVNANGVIVAVNAAWRRFSDKHRAPDAKCKVDENYFEACAATTFGDAGMILARLHTLLRGEEAEIRLETQWRMPDGSSIPYQLRATRFGSGAGLRLVLAYEDVSELKRSEGALRDLTARMFRVQDDERRRIARDLHDSTAQSLTGASLAITAVLRSMQSSERTSVRLLEDSVSLIESSQREIRTASYLLHPPILDIAGIGGAVRWFGEGFEKRTGIKVYFEIEKDLSPLDPEIETAILRVVQEGLSNVHRHAESVDVWIRLEKKTDGDETRIVLTVEDSGKGLPTKFLHPGRNGEGSILDAGENFGLAGMRERLAYLGGSLTVEPGDIGTILRAVIPTRKRPLRGAIARDNAVSG